MTFPDQIFLEVTSVDVAEPDEANESSDAVKGHREGYVAMEVGFGPTSKNTNQTRGFFLGKGGVERGEI